MGRKGKGKGGNGPPSTTPTTPAATVSLPTKLNDQIKLTPEKTDIDIKENLIEIKEKISPNSPIPLGQNVEADTENAPQNGAPPTIVDGSMNTNKKKKNKKSNNGQLQPNQAVNQQPSKPAANSLPPKEPVLQENGVSENGVNSSSGADENGHSLSSDGTLTARRKRNQNKNKNKNENLSQEIKKHEQQPQKQIIKKEEQKTVSEQQEEKEVAVKGNGQLSSDGSDTLNKKKKKNNKNKKKATEENSLEEIKVAAEKVVQSVELISKELPSGNKGTPTNEKVKENKNQNQNQNQNKKNDKSNKNEEKISKEENIPPKEEKNINVEKTEKVPEIVNQVSQLEKQQQSKKKEEKPQENKEKNENKSKNNNKKNDKRKIEENIQKPAASEKVKESTKEDEKALLEKLPKDNDPPAKHAEEKQIVVTKIEEVKATTKLDDSPSKIDAVKEGEAQKVQQQKPLALETKALLEKTDLKIEPTVVTKTAEDKSKIEEQKKKVETKIETVKSQSPPKSMKAEDKINSTVISQEKDDPSQTKSESPVITSEKEMKNDKPQPKLVEQYQPLETCTVMEQKVSAPVELVTPPPQLATKEVPTSTPPIPPIPPSIIKPNKELEKQLLSAALAELIDSVAKVEVPLKEAHPEIDKKQSEPNREKEENFQNLGSNPKPQAKNRKSKSPKPAVKNQSQQQLPVVKTATLPPIGPCPSLSQIIEQQPNVEAPQVPPRKLSTDSKNVERSDFAQSADLATVSATVVKSQETQSIQRIKKTESKDALDKLVASIISDSSKTAVASQGKMDETEREIKNSTPTTNKRNKDDANLKEVQTSTEAKTHDSQEKSPQEKLEPIQFTPIKLLDILDAKMTAPADEKSKDAETSKQIGNAETSQKDQLKVQPSSKNRSKSPKKKMSKTGNTVQPLTVSIIEDATKSSDGHVKNEPEVDNKIKEIVTNTELQTITENKTGTGPKVVSDPQNEKPKIVDNKQNNKQGNLKTNDKGQKTQPRVGNQGAIKKDDNKKQENLQTVAAQTKISVPPTALDVAKKNEKLIEQRPEQSEVNKNLTDENKVEKAKKNEEVLAKKSSMPTENKIKETSLQQGAKSPENKTKPSTENTVSTKPTGTTPKQEQNSSKKPDIPPKPETIPPIQKKSPPPKSEERKASSPPTPIIPPKPEHLNKNAPEIPQPLNKKPSPPIPIEDEEEYIEYKFTPRQVFLSTICQICKTALTQYTLCKTCHMVSYCNEEHLKEDESNHKGLCSAIQEIAKKRGGHVYNNAKILTNDDFRNLRVHTLNLCESILSRLLQPFEKEILLFPRICVLNSCREWRPQQLSECKNCGQVSYCTEHPDHLSETHQKWCKSFALYQKLIIRQKISGRIEPTLPSRIFSEKYKLPISMDDIFKDLYKSNPSLTDECVHATLTQLATAPLTALASLQKCNREVGESLTIHLIGAELQFEGDTLDKWEAFFLHLVPQLRFLRIVFIGPELNSENLPLDILSRIRMCRTCRQACRSVKFDFQCGKLYHDYVRHAAFTKPDLICFFNPGLYRSTGFSGQDTWPDTIKSATQQNCPILVTSYTEIEAPQDLERIQKECGKSVNIIHPPGINQYSSQRPERNFISDEVAPMIFKNFFCFVIN